MALSSTALALIGLTTLSAGGVAYALLAGRISRDAQTEKRIDAVQKRNPVAAAATRAKAAETNRRRKSIQDSLKEMEERQKAKARQRPSLAIRFQQAGLNWSKRFFYILSTLIALAIGLGTRFAGLPIYANVVLAGVGFVGIPRWLVNFRRKRRLKKFLNDANTNPEKQKQNLIQMCRVILNLNEFVYPN